MVENRKKYNLYNYRGLNMPICEASSHSFDSCKEFMSYSNEDKLHLQYGRTGSLTSLELQKEIKKLENAKISFITPTGLAAIFMTLGSLLKAGDHLLMSEGTYSYAQVIVEDWLVKYGVEFSYYEPGNIEDFEFKIQKNTRFIYTELPTSILMELDDIDQILEIAHKKNILIGVDATWATPLYFKALNKGFDVVIQSGTKYLSGHSDYFLGTISSNRDEVIELLKKSQFILGMRVSQSDSYSILRSLHTLEMRVKKAEELAVSLAKWLFNRKEIGAVYHPALESHPQHNIWKKHFSGSTGLFSISFKDKISKKKIFDFIDNCKSFYIGVSWGGTESLMLPFEIKNYRSLYNKKYYNNNYVIRIYTGITSELENLKESMEDAFKYLY